MTIFDFNRNEIIVGVDTDVKEIVESVANFAISNNNIKDVSDIGSIDIVIAENVVQVDGIVESFDIVKEVSFDEWFKNIKDDKGTNND